MDGTSLAMMPVSLTNTTSAAKRSLCSRRKSSKWTEPTSSSPSIMNLMLHGTWSVATMASNALTCMKNCPLSSQAPRAKMAPSGCSSVFLITGSKAGLSHKSMGSAGCTS